MRQPLTRPHLALLALAVLLAVLRLHYLDWPPNRDVTTYSVIAREVLEGEQLYTDVWDHKPAVSAVPIEFPAPEIHLYRRTARPTGDP